jgi:hypothetical protein
MKVYQEWDGSWHVHPADPSDPPYLYCLAIFRRNDWRGAIDAACADLRKRAES